MSRSAILRMQATELPSITPDVMKIEAVQRFGGKTPQLLQEVKPLYTREAAADRIEGIVGLEAVVLPDGSVGAVRVKQSLHPALDVLRLLHSRRGGSLRAHWVASRCRWLFMSR